MSFANPIKGHVAVVDDDNEMRSMLEDYFRSQDYQVSSFSSAIEALEKLRPIDPPDVVVSDIRMPKMDGLEFTAKIKDKFPDTCVILITAFGSIETAVEAIRRGAYDYLIKPFKLAALEVVINRALGFQKLKRENKTLRAAQKTSYSLQEMIGKNPSMKEVFELIHRIAPSMANVLISGEVGTGKEMLARTIHNISPRSGKPFMAINCTSIPEALFEAELFGHVKGAFPGASHDKQGIFDEAFGGTLFIDEIGDLDAALQAKLLRVLQDQKIKPVGATEYHSIDVRIIAATQKDLRQAIRQNNFREDLYYRLAVVPISLPPLRYRQDDIPILAQHFIEKYTAINSLPSKTLSPSALHKLVHARWDGNVRDLENVIERTVILSKNSVIEESEIQMNEQSDTEKFFGKAIEAYPTMEDLEKKYIQYILNKTGGRKEKAAQILGINRRTLYRKEREYGFVEDNGSLHEDDLD